MLTDGGKSLNYLSGLVLIPWGKFLNYSGQVMLTPGRRILDYFEDLEDLRIERCKRHWRMAMFETNPIDLKDLLDDVEEGKIQLPDFQRGWVWDDERIKGLLVSISR